jgi:hypothetical protein
LGLLDHLVEGVEVRDHDRAVAAYRPSVRLLTSRFGAKL